VIRFDLVTNQDEPFVTLPLSNHPNGVNVYVLSAYRIIRGERMSWTCHEKYIKAYIFLIMRWI